MAAILKFNMVVIQNRYGDGIKRTVGNTNTGVDTTSILISCPQVEIYWNIKVNHGGHFEIQDGGSTTLITSLAMVSLDSLVLKT